MKSSAVSFQQLLNLQNQQKVLRDGGSVLVRVLADKGNGKYEVSVAGTRLNISAKNPLKVGQSFVANVNTVGKQIQLTPQNQEIAAKNQNMFVEIADSKIFSFLSSIGLPADNISYNIMQQFKQLNMKLNVPLMNRIHQLASRYEGKEKLASQIMINLINKGLDAEDSEIEKIIMMLDDESYKSEKMSENILSAVDVNSFKLLIQDYFYKLFNDDSKSKIDILAINNHFPGWIYLPFEILKIDSTVLGEGCIKLLIDKSKILKKILVSCNYENKIFNYNLDFVGNDVRTVRFNIAPFDYDKIDEECKKLKNKFASVGRRVEIHWDEKEEIEGTGAGSEKIVMFGGEV